ncbi:late nodulin [Medicago truncatula]|uniref:Late nodulin n=1 Tax=Medicago truncatula TaxID=3880 RepID=A7KHC9_MEDTR|nr:nodule-specific cysteine-rich peptide 265 [Medicago truncatula]KEH27852.1 late nodulin [Medicago truncatula]
MIIQFSIYYMQRRKLNMVEILKFSHALIIFLFLSALVTNANIFFCSTDEDCTWNLCRQPWVQKCRLHMCSCEKN